jgi:hypothetical protein
MGHPRRRTAFSARYDDDHTFGDWPLAPALDDLAHSAWSWSLVPLGVLLGAGAYHVLNAMAIAIGRWTTARLDR